MGKYWWEEDNKQAKDQHKKDQGKGYWWEKDGTVTNTATSNITDRVNSWLKNHSSYISDYQNRYSGRKGTYEDSYVSDSASWLDKVSKQKSNFDAEADSILAYMDQYKGYLDAKWMDDVRKTIAGARDQQKGIYDSAVSDNQWWSSFKDEDDYNFWRDHSTVESRQAWYAEKKKRLDELKAEKDKDDDYVTRRAEELYQSGEYTSMLHAMQTALEEYNNEIEALETDIRNYERGNYDENGRYYGRKVVDDYSSYSKLPDFNAVSSSRNTVNPTREDLGKYDLLNDSSTWNYDNNGILRDADGNEIKKDASGRFVNPKASEYAVKDRLGIFLGATDEEREEYMGTIVGGTWGDIISQGIDGSWDQLEEDEVRTYYYILNSEGKESADKFLDEMKPELNRREAAALAKENAEKYQNADFFEKVGMNIATVPAQLLSGIAGAAENASYMLRGQEINPYSFAHSGSNYSNIVRGETAADLDSTGIKIPGIDFTLGDAYQAGMSILDSYAAIGIGGQLGGVLLATGAASSEATRLYEQGATREQIALGSAAAGAAEMVFESLSIDKLINMKDAKTVGQIIKNALVQGGIEASEEGFTEIANIITNSIIMGNQSDWNKLVEKYNGDEFSAFLEKVKDVARASLSGFISGAGSSAVPSAVSYAANKLQQNEEAKQTYGEYQAEIVEASLEIDPDNAYAKKLQAKLQGGKDLSGRQLRKLVEKNTDTFAKNVISKIQESAKKRLTDLGETSNVDDIAKLVAKQVAGEELTRSEVSALVRSQYGSKVAKEIRDGQLSVNQESRMEESESMTSNDQQVISQLEEQAPTKVAEDGVTIQASTGNEITPKKIVSIDGDEAMIQTDSGTISANDIAFGDENTDLLWRGAASFTGITPQSANGIIRAYLGNESVSTYLRGAAQEFQNGYYNKNSGGVYADKLTPAQREIIYGLGQKSAGENTAKAQAKATAAKRATVSKTGKVGKVHFDFDRKGRTFDAVQETALTTMEQLSAALGVEFYVYESYRNAARELVYKDASGNEVHAPNGYYDPSDGSIHIDLNAGATGKGTMLFTVAHELTHFIKQWSPAKFKVLANVLVKQYSKNGATVDSLVEAQLTKAKNNKKELTWDEAFEEVVADSMESILTSGNVVQAMAEVKKQDKGLWKKICDWFKDLAAKLRAVTEAYKNYKPDSKEGKMVAEMRDVIAELEKVYTEALVEAGDNFQAAIEAEAVKSLGENAKVETNAEGELLLASNERGNVQVYSERTYLDGGRDKLENALRQNGHTEAEIKQTLSYVDDALDYIKILAAGYAKNMGYTNLSDHLVADIITNVKTGKQVMSAIVNNGDYPVNIDLSLICKKRVAYMNLMSRLIRDGVFDKVNYDGAAIAEVNEILRANDFETACLGCFVESRRLQFQTWAETIVSEWNAEVEKRNPNAKEFGFAKGKMEELTDADINALTRELETADKNVQGNVNLGQGNSVTRMGRLLDALPSLQKKLTVEDLLTPEGLTALRKHDGSLFSIVKSRYGAASPKIVQDFNPYASEIAMLTFAHVKNITNNAVAGAQDYVKKVKSEYGTLKKAKGESKADFDQRKKDHAQRIQDEAMRRYLYDIGGARIQSFSDFMIENIFDYIQIFADLSAKRLPLHGYSKEIVCLRLFGMTGAKWNGSLIAHVERNMGKEYAGLLPAGTKDGIPVTVDGKEYVIGFDDYARNSATGGKSFIQSIGMKDIIALQLDPRYSPYVGNITIGVSDKQILAMLDSPLFRMVIPYHASGMLPMFAKLVGVDMYNDYTDYQNTTVRQYYDLDGNAVSELKNAKGEAVKADTSYAFNAEIQKTKDARAAANNYLNWCAQRHPVYDHGKLVGYATFNPKFSSSPYGTDFTRHENYYKLLEDFNTYDCITEASTVQGAVTMNFPSEANRLTAQQMEAYKEALRETGIFTEKDIEKYAKKADMTFKEIISAEVGNRANYAATQAPKWESTVKEVEEKLQRDYARDTAAQPKDGVKNSDRGTAELDQAYMAAVERGDMETVQKLVYEAAKRAGYTVSGHHGTNAMFNKFSPDFMGRNGLAFGPGFYFTTRRGTASSYEDSGGRIIDAYLKVEKSLSPDEKTMSYSQMRKFAKALAKVSKNQKISALTTLSLYSGSYTDIDIINNLWYKARDDIRHEDFFGLLRETLGYDSVKADFEGANETFYVVFNADQIKSSDPVTYDDSGNVIPLSKRFNAKDDDIRYSERDSRGKQLTKEQVEFFKDSVVRDNKGNLKVMYHGTNAEFTVFDKSKLRDKLGFFFTDYEWEASDYGTPKKYYLNISNPFDMFGDTPLEDFAGDAPKYIDGKFNYEAILNGLMAAGYDGMRSFSHGKEWYVAFSPEQIKDVSNNKPTSSQDTRYSDRDPEQEKVTRLLEKENADLKEDVAHLRELVKLQSQVTDGTKFTKTSVEAAAGNLIKSINAKGDKKELAKLLNGLYEYIANGEEITFEGIKEEAQAAVNWLTSRVQADETPEGYSYDDELFSQEVMRQVYDSYWNVSTLRTVADKYQKQINQLKYEHSKRMSALREYHKEKTAKLKKEHKEKLQRVRQEYRERMDKQYKDITERYRESRKKREESREKTELRRKIRKTIRELDKILNRGNKKRNVKEDMKDFVAYALASAEILFTDNYSNEDMIRNGVETQVAAKENRLIEETQRLLRQRDDLYSVGAVKDELDDVIAGDTSSYDKRMEMSEELDKKIARNMYALRSVFERERARINSASVSGILDGLAKAYKELGTSDNLYVRNAVDENVYQHLRSMSERMDGAIVKDMNLSQLEDLYKAYTMVLHTVRSANQLFVQGKTESIEKMAGRIMGDFSKRKTPEGTAATVLRNLSNKIGWDYEKLYYALDRIGSEAFTELVMNIANSENIVMQDVMEAAAFRDEMVKKYGFNNWDVNKKIDREFLDNTGKKFNMTLGQMMALYAYSRREGAWDHIEYGGFVFGERELTNPRPADSYKLSKEQCEAITDLLTKEQKSYVEDMQKFLSETMGEKGNEVSMMLYGIKMFTEKNYFPIHIAGQFKAQANESQAKAAAGFTIMTNAGFTHAQNPNAKAPFVLEGFNEIWVDHVNEMSRYHGTVPALEDMRRVMNSSSYSETSAESMSLKQMMENAYGKEAVDYFDNLYREANSGAITDKLQKTSQKLLSLFRKNSVAYSLSVLVQQTASIVRAYSLIDRKYFGFKGFGTITSGVAKAVSDKWTKAHTNAYNEMLKYAPGVTMAKEIGGFDTATGGSIRSYLLDTGKSLKQKWNTGTAAEKGKAVLDLVDDNAIANLPNLADKIAWIEIWNACKREAVAKHKDLAPNSEEFMQAVGERFTEVIRATQVYDSIFAKSPMLKSKNLAVQYLVSFANEPNTVANMAEKAVRDATKGNWKGGLRTAGVLIHSIIFTNVMKSIIYAMRDDDEDETYIEKYIEAVAGNMMSDFNPLNYIPVARDVVSLAQGYDVERADMAVVSDAIDALTSVIKNATKETDGMTEEQIIAFDKKVTEANWRLVESIATFFGIPVKNIRREIVGVINHAKIAHANVGKTTAHSAWEKAVESAANSIPFVQTSKAKQDKLYEAIISGDKTYVARLKAGYKDDAAYNIAVRKALRENDPRIHEAAQARYNGNIAECKRIYNEIKNEGKFSPNDILEAINSEESKIRNEEKPETVSSSYSSTDFVNAVIVGDTSLAATMKDDIISAKVANGKSQEEAEEAFTTSVSTATRNAFDSSLLDEAGAKKMLREYAGMDEEEADSKVRYWAMAKAYPQYRDDLSEARVEKYNEFAEPAGISLDVFVQYLRGTSGLETKYDKWGDVEESVRDQVLAVIDSLPITWEQKDALYLAAGYAESNIWDVPW